MTSNRQSSPTHSTNPPPSITQSPTQSINMSNVRHPMPISLRDLRTDAEVTNFAFLKPSAVDEERIQRLIEDKMLQPTNQSTDQSPHPATEHDKHASSEQPAKVADKHITQSTPQSTKPKPHPPTSLPASLPTVLPSDQSINEAFSINDLIPFVQHGLSKIIEDDFSKCFQAARSPPWNWNFYLYPLWLAGVLIRYCILFPIRLTSLLLGFAAWALMLCCIKLFVKDVNVRTNWERRGIKFLCSCFVFSWTGVIRYHGRIPTHKPNQIYVANHTSLIDIVILSQLNTFSMVGQQQKGFVGFFQNHILACLNNCFFNRAEANDRAMAAARIKQHIADPSSNRLLIFPEGTCVNNEYCVQFKQGAFDMNAEVVPIAIKYNKVFVDAFWNSRAQSFPMHLLTLMTSWAVVCDVWYLQPQYRKEDETPIEFSDRVKRMICERAKLKDVNWDGYLKHFRPSQRYIKEQQRRVANSILEKWERIKQQGSDHSKSHLDNPSVYHLTDQKDSHPTIIKRR